MTTDITATDPSRRRDVRGEYGSLIRRAIWLGLLLTIAVGTALLQLDRQTRISPTMAGVVPAFFQSQALERRVELAVQRRDADALEMARDLVLRRPIPAESLTLFSLAAAFRGESEIADDAMAIAAARGWRVTIPNILALNGAYAAGHWKESVRRLVALHKMQAANESTAEGLAVIALAEEGRAALVEYASADPNFASFLIRTAVNSVKAGQAVDMIDRAKKQGAQFSCEDVRWATRAMLRNGEGTNARLLWNKDCARKSSGSTNLTSRTLSGAEENPFAWQFKGKPGLSRSFREEAIRFRNKDPIKRVIAQRMFTFEPGRYELNLKTRAPSNRLQIVDADLVFNVKCFPSRKAANLLQRKFAANLQVADNCPVQLLEMSIGRGELTVTGFEITKLD